jgi:hypothetical protein
MQCRNKTIAEPPKKSKGDITATKKPKIISYLTNTAVKRIISKKENGSSIVC